MANKYPAFYSFVTGISGTFIPQSVVSKGGDKKNLVSFKYCPINSMMHRTYPILIPKDNIVNFDNFDNSFAGVEPRMVFITGDANGKAPIFDKIFGEKGSILQDAQRLKKENEGYRIQISMLENKVKELSKDSKKQIATAHEMNRQQNDNNPRSPFNRYGGSMNGLPQAPTFRDMD